ncbi:MAG: guanylate kinase [Deltaproteobacteria bacterium]|nr:guanylate kinase [Deltaproteobacteria bacterium]
MHKKLFVISAPSGAGKTTLCLKLIKDIPHIILSISSTTRPPRRGEKDGVDYFFISHDEFQNKIKTHQFAEWAIVHSNYYGTSKKFIEDTLKNGNAILLDIDIQGAASLRKVYPELSYTIFIAPPNLQALEKRLRSRGTDSETIIQKRLKNATKELQEAKQFDKIILNDNLERAYLELKNLIKEKLCLNKCTE